jgi:hypothetical protein
LLCFVVEERRSDGVPVQFDHLRRVEIERGGCLFETMGNVAAEIRRIIGMQRDGNATA